jgi:hypothetical protein|tara:strand:- start:382 stop:651 length:270 start_codon:yes stop_codon:yes gene_type:complete
MICRRRARIGGGEGFRHCGIDRGLKIRRRPRHSISVAILPQRGAQPHDLIRRLDALDMKAPPCVVQTLACGFAPDLQSIDDIGHGGLLS